MTFGFGYDLKLVLLLYLGCFLALVFIGGCTRLLGLHKTRRWGNYCILSSRLKLLIIHAGK